MKRILLLAFIHGFKASYASVLVFLDVRHSGLLTVLRPYFYREAISRLGTSQRISKTPSPTTCPTMRWPLPSTQNMKLVASWPRAPLPFSNGNCWLTCAMMTGADAQDRLKEQVMDLRKAHLDNPWPPNDRKVGVILVAHSMG